MKVCDVTQFYSPVSGGVKRYVHEKIAYIDSLQVDEHVLIIPGRRTEIIFSGRSRIYSIASPMISSASQYRVLLNLRALEEVLEREKPDIVESADPYQVGWKTLRACDALRIPAVAFYHSHFAEAYLRGAERFIGEAMGAGLMNLAQIYVRNLYNRFAMTFVPSRGLQEVLRSWGVTNLQTVSLGVNIDIFSPTPDDAESTRGQLNIARERRLILYVGRLAKEKNTKTLFRAFELLSEQMPGAFHLLVVGDGPERRDLLELQARSEHISWIRYCADSGELARYYRAADMFVHPGVQETFGLVALESQACGAPVLGIRGSHMDENILHDQTGWAAANSPEAFAEAIKTFSPQRLSMLGTTAAEAVRKRYTWARVFDELFCFYRDVCANYPRAAA